MRALVLFIVLLLLSSCSAQRVAESTVRDSIRVEVVERVVEVRDTVRVEIPLIIERVTIHQDSSYLSNKFAVSHARVLPDGELFHSLETIPQIIEKPIETEAVVSDSIVYRDREIINTQTIEVPRQLTKWQHWQMSGFWVLALVLITMIYFKLK